MKDNQAKYPQLRFKGFTDPWEQCKLRGILAERNDQITETKEYPLMSFVQGKGVTPKGKRYNRSFLVKDVVAPLFAVFSRPSLPVDWQI